MRQRGGRSSAAAWEVAHESGLISVTLREIAARIGMRPPSLYSHFASKNAIYDAMFAQAWDEFHAVLEKAVPAFPADPRGRLLALANTYFDFAVSDLERHQLMDMPMLPDFTPSEQAYRSSLQVLRLMRSLMDEIGIHRQADLDLYTALIGGLVNQQLANDPKGDRWRATAARGRSPFSPTTSGLPPATAVPPEEEEMKPRTSALDRKTAMRLAATEYRPLRRTAAVTRPASLGDARTACPDMGRPPDGRPHARHGRDGRLDPRRRAPATRGHGQRRHRHRPHDRAAGQRARDMVRARDRDRFAARAAKAVRDGG